MDSKACNKCSIVKPIDDYHVKKIGKKGQKLYQGICKKCLNAYNLKKYHNENEEQRERRKLLNSYSHMKRKYGLTPDDFSAMILKQNNQCKICDCEMDDPQIDHNHSTGKIRGLLCKPCNMSLGLLKEDTNSLRNMISYIENDNLQEDSI